MALNTSALNDRSILENKIVHLDYGAFHRAHQAWVLDTLHRISPSN